MLSQKLLGADIGSSTGTFSFISITPVYKTSSTFVALTYPAGIQAGDLLFITGFINSATAFGAITGWGTYATTGSYGSVLYKVADGTETGSVNVTWSVAAVSVHVMVVIRHSSGVTPSVEVAAAVYNTNPAVTLAPPSVNYTQAAHMVNYTDNSLVTMTGLNANLTLLQYRSTSYGSWLGWIDTSTLGLINTTITSNSNSNSLSCRLFVFYV